MKILMLTAEGWPTFRADIRVLFGKYLANLGVVTDLATELDTQLAESADWIAGEVRGFKLPKSRAFYYPTKLWHQLKILCSIKKSEYQFILVRDMVWIALFALIYCKFKKSKFIYWLSYPQSEGQVSRALQRGMVAGLKFWFPLIQGTIGGFVLYKFVLPFADHVFVQSPNMLEAVAKRGIDKNNMTSVLMGVDIENINPKPIAFTHERFAGKRLLIYLGSFDPNRNVEMLFETLAIVKKKIPNVMLIMAGDTEEKAHKDWLLKQVEQHQVSEDVFWTGWVPMHIAWQYVTAAELGYSPIPRSFLLDMASPTKAVEYMALGVPVVGNDNPDQANLIRASHGGYCVNQTAGDFASATINLLNNERVAKQMAESGYQYVTKHRDYQQIAKQVYAVLNAKLSEDDQCVSLRT